MPMLVALLAFFLWLVALGLLVRPFGVQLPLGPFSFGKGSALQALTFSQYVLVCGILGFGCGMLIVTTVSNYVEWKYFHGSSVSLTSSGLLRAFVEYPLVSGVLFGLISWNTRTGRSTK
jgi:hypothetical protein